MASFTELQAWFGTASPEFVFLVALSFAVAIAGLAADSMRRRRQASPAAPAQAAVTPPADTAGGPRAGPSPSRPNAPIKTPAGQPGGRAAADRIARAPDRAVPTQEH